MHIAVDTHCIIPGHVGGIEQYTIGLLQRLTGAGSPADQLLILTRPENHAVMQRFESLRNVQIICQPRPTSGWDSPAAAAKLRQFQEQKRRILHQHHVDVVHFPGNTINPIDLDLPVVLNLHDLQHKHYPQYFLAEELARRDKWWAASARRANALLAASRFVADDLHSQFGVDSNRIIVSPDPLQDEFLTAPTAQQQATVRTRLALHDPFFLYPAAVWPHKNHDRLLRAFAGIGDAPVQLVLTGGGQESPALHEHIRSLKLNTRVRLLGRVDTLTLKCLYRLATALMMPSEHESISIPILEAMASGCPIGCSNVTALPEQTAGAALLFDPTDVAGITATMQLLLDDPVMRNTLIRRGTARLAAFSTSASTEALGRAYQLAIGTFTQARAA